jgi:hypothetical protein
LIVSISIILQVWSASKPNLDDAEQPTHELDVLRGHENDVNYVQFSGCAVAPKSSTADALKEDSYPKFKNSWFVSRFKCWTYRHSSIFHLLLVKN